MTLKFITYIFRECWKEIYIILNILRQSLIYFNIFFSSSQVLEQLNVFADEDIDAAAEALDDVSLYLISLWHIPWVISIFICVVCLSWTLPLPIDGQTDRLNQLL